MVMLEGCKSSKYKPDNSKKPLPDETAAFAHLTMPTGGTFLLSRL